MKAIWKILMGAAAVAAVAPYSVKKDEETGAVEVKSVTWKATYTKNGDDRHVELKLLPALQRDTVCECECEDEDCCCDDECRCEETPEDEDEGITIDVTVEPEEPAPEEPKPEEA